MKLKINRNIYQFVCSIMIIVMSLFSIIYTTFNVEQEGYEFLWTLPLIFLIMYFLILNNILFKKFRIFITSFTVISFFRYVIMPIMIVMTNYYGGRSQVMPNIESFQGACFLMCYEFIILTVSIFIFNRIYQEKNNDLENQTDIKLPRNKFVYLIFFAITFLAIVIVPKSLDFFSIIIPRMSDSEYLASQSFIQSVVTYMIFTSKNLIYILAISWCYKKYDNKKENKRYKFLAFMFTILNISIFFGLNRSDLLIPAIASVLIYMQLFKDKKIGKYIVCGLIIILLIISIGSSRKIVSVSKDTDSLVDTADFMQVYLGGVYNVAISIETYDYYPESRDFTRLLFDTFRPFIGMNVFLKNIDMNFTNDYFNKRIWFNDFSSQILPMIGQGYIHFGEIFSPILGVLVIWISFVFERIMKKYNRIEINYFLTICLLRMGFLMGQNTSNMSNEISMNLVMFVIIYYLNNKIVYKKRRKLLNEKN